MLRQADHDLAGRLLELSSCDRHRRGKPRMGSRSLGEHAGKCDDDEGRDDPSGHAGASAGLGAVGGASERRCAMRITSPEARSETSPAVTNADW